MQTEEKRDTEAEQTPAGQTDGKIERKNDRHMARQVNKQADTQGKSPIER